MFQPTLPMYTPRFKLDPALIVSVQDTIRCELSRTGSSWSSHGTVDHPSFTRLRNYLEKQGHIVTSRVSSNGDRVIEPFVLNDVLFESGDTFYCASAMSHYLERQPKNPLPQPPEPKFDAELHGYRSHTTQSGFILEGKIYGDKKQRFDDGERIYTSLVVKLDGDLAYTRNSVYKLC